MGGNFHSTLPLERLSDDWVSPIYAFFQPTPSIEAVDGRRVHEFKCAASHCKGRGKNPRFVQRYLDTSDRNSTGNLRKHARLCWGEEILRGADACGDLDSTRKGLDKAKKLQDGSITTAFERKGKGKVTFSHRQHTKTQTRLVMTLQLSNIPNVAWFRAEIVRWVSESHRPFSIVEDRGFRCLMKTGRPEYYLPSARTVSRDVKEVFKKARSRIAKILRVRDQVGMTRPIKLTYLLGT